jgi:hypothetical protein
VEFDGNWFIAIYLPLFYVGKMGGLCGNNDNDPTNDLTLANGTFVGNLTNGAKIFGDSYVVRDMEQTDAS